MITASRAAPSSRVISELSRTSMPYRRAVSVSAREKTGTLNIAGSGSTRMVRIALSTPRLRQWSAARYAIFCGAPPHFTGPDGMVNTAVPRRIRRMKSQVSGARSGR